MTTPEIVALLQEKFGNRVHPCAEDCLDPHVVVEPADLVEIATFLRDDERTQFEILNCVTGTDFLEPDAKKAAKAGFEPHLEVVYHLSSFRHRHRFALKISLPRWRDDVAGQLPQVPTLTGVWKAADWHEREVFDLVGIWFEGHPDLRRILLSEDWVGHPLRKDYEFPLEYHGVRCR